MTSETALSTTHNDVTLRGFTSQRSCNTDQYGAGVRVGQWLSTFQFLRKNWRNKCTSYMGRVSEFQALMRDSLMSTTVTVISGHIWAITLHVGPPTYPAPMQQILFIWTIWKDRRTFKRECPIIMGLWPDLIYITLNLDPFFSDSACYSLTNNDHLVKR